ncbi:MAG TPA: lytic transglycosylase domain-containing protein [Spirochaetota bacterium]|nr:lytic transglycosylase domain-containing protein [Spirochaetota bacterium]HPI88265.1 lytic transglycosylase domain-containing protein [Spirochaetota bacterium]
MSTLPLLCLLLCLVTAPAGAEIQKRVHRDGSVEYYNREIKRQKLPASSYDGIIEKIARQQGVDPYLVKCIIKIESNFNADAVSVAGAMGLMQLMQETARYYKVRDPLDPEENIHAGIKHLRSLLEYFNQDVPLALAAYHAGMGRVKKNMSIPPIKSTVDYVNNVMKLYSGNGDYSERVKVLYQKIEKDGTILIYSR